MPLERWLSGLKQQVANLCPFTGARGFKSHPLRFFMKLFLVRYGEHTDGHLNEQGRQTMALASERLKSFVVGQTVCLACANVPRAVESAEIISENLKVFPVQKFKDLYAAQENGVDINLEAAFTIISSLFKENSLVIAVVSREYIEALPSYILNSLGVKETIETHLDRGEALMIDYEKKEMNYLR